MKHDICELPRRTLSLDFLPACFCNVTMKEWGKNLSLTFLKLGNCHSLSLLSHGEVTEAFRYLSSLKKLHSLAPGCLLWVWTKFYFQPWKKKLLELVWIIKKCCLILFWVSNLRTEWTIVTTTKALGNSWYLDNWKFLCTKRNAIRARPKKIESSDLGKYLKQLLLPFLEHLWENSFT